MTARYVCTVLRVSYMHVYINPIAYDYNTPYSLKQYFLCCIISVRLSLAWIKDLLDRLYYVIITIIIWRLEQGESRVVVGQYLVDFVQGIQNDNCKHCNGF